MNCEAWWPRHRRRRQIRVIHLVAFLLLLGCSIITWRVSWKCVATFTTAAMASSSPNDQTNNACTGRSSVDAASKSQAPPPPKRETKKATATTGTLAENKFPTTRIVSKNGIASNSRNGTVQFIVDTQIMTDNSQRVDTTQENKEQKPNAQLSNSNTTTKTTGSLLDVQARAFDTWDFRHDAFPCFHPTIPTDDDNDQNDQSATTTGSPWHWTNKRNVLRKPTRRGFFFVKLLKCASSTAVSVHLRLARNYYYRYTNVYGSTATRNQTNRTALYEEDTDTAATSNKQSFLALNNTNVSSLYYSSDTDEDWEICRTRHLHGSAQHYQYGNRDTTQSFLWSMVRQPVPRYLSEFFHFEVSRRNVSVDQMQSFFQTGPHSDQHTLSWLALSPYASPYNRRPQQQQQEWQRNRNHQYAQNYAVASTTSRDDTATAELLKWSARQRQQRQRSTPIIQEIINQYNFLGVTERFDESMVVLAMILNRPLADVLYISAKTSGNYDDGEFGNRCIQIQHTYVPPKVQTFLEKDPEWLLYIEPEQELYRAVNRSLDLTIEALGASRVRVQLTRFRHAQQVVAQRCPTDSVVNIPCTSQGERIPHNETDCLQGDMGCGFECLDRVATMLDLW